MADRHRQDHVFESASNYVVWLEIWQLHNLPSEYSRISRRPNLKANGLANENPNPTVGVA
jgi:hypothetical protein